jgi:hypothetical protein
MPVASCVEHVPRLEWERDRAREFTASPRLGFTLAGSRHARRCMETVEGKDVKQPEVQASSVGASHTWLPDSPGAHGGGADGLVRRSGAGLGPGPRPSAAAHGAASFLGGARACHEGGRQDVAAGRRASIGAAGDAALSATCRRASLGAISRSWTPRPSACWCGSSPGTRCGAGSPARRRTISARRRSWCWRRPTGACS